jgi:ABC-2 type transport system ATP-binding protein
VNDSAVSVNGVSKRFRVYHERNQSLKAAVMRGRRSSHEDFWALRDIDLEIPHGSSFALVGDNGSGKSTLLKCLARILYPDTGTIETRGRVAALLEVGSGFHPELSGRDNVFLNASILGMTRPEILRKFDEIVAFSGVEQFIDQPVKNYSSGMYVRLGFSVAINVEPEILLVDEVLAVGDAAFQDKCAEKFASFKREGRTVVVVSHSIPSLRAMVDQAAWIEKGRLRESGNASAILERYLDSTHVSPVARINGNEHLGSGEVRIDRVEVLRADGAPTPICTGDAVRFRVHYTAHERVSRPVVGFAIEATDGTYLCATNTRDAGDGVPELDGSGVLECLMPALHLHPGSYSVVASVTDETTTHLIDQVRNIAGFSVDSGGVVWSGGYVALPSRWGSPDRAVVAGPRATA